MPRKQKCDVIFMASQGCGGHSKSRISELQRVQGVAVLTKM